MNQGFLHSKYATQFQTMEVTWETQKNSKKMDSILNQRVIRPHPLKHRPVERALPESYHYFRQILYIKEWWNASIFSYSNISLHGHTAGNAVINPTYKHFRKSRQNQCGGGCPVCQGTHTNYIVAGYHAEHCPRTRLPEVSWVRKAFWMDASIHPLVIAKTIVLASFPWRY